MTQTGTTNLVATGDATNWISSNPSVLTVNSSGVITGVGPGTATVSATVGGVTGTSGNITVTPQPFSIATASSATLPIPLEAPLGMGRSCAPSAGTAATINNGLMLPGNDAGGIGYSGYVTLPNGIINTPPRSRWNAG